MNYIQSNPQNKTDLIVESCISIDSERRKRYDSILYNAEMNVETGGGMYSIHRVEDYDSKLEPSV